MPEPQLAQANRHIAEAMQRTARLRARIASLELDGLTPAAAQLSSLLDSFEVTLRLMLEHRDELLSADRSWKPR
jgi:hypothetical protein